MNDLIGWIVLVLLISASTGEGANAGINWRYDGKWHNLYLFNYEESKQSEDAKP